MRNFTDDLARLRVRLGEAEEYLGQDRLTAEQEQLDVEIARPDLWEDQEEARKITGRHAVVTGDLELLTELRSRLADAETLFELGLEEDDESVESEIAAAVAALDAKFQTLELRALFTGEYDEGDALLEINSGAGGVDAQDWAEMLFRMYTRWAENRGLSWELDWRTEGNEAGISSAGLTVKGRYAYGLLSSERGVHRLVRISPFDAQARRQTSFAGVSLTPIIEDATSKVVIDDKDLKVDVFRSSGAGGQHVNTTDSAVRMTHMPTGIVVSCQIERSQIQNRARCMDMLANKIIDLQRQQREEMLASITGPTKDAAWGNQIRSYVLAPYQMVKDLRNNEETAKVDAVLDGEIDQFMEAWLRWRRAGMPESS